MVGTLQALETPSQAQLPQLCQGLPHLSDQVLLTDTIFILAGRGPLERSIQKGLVLTSLVSNSNRCLILGIFAVRRPAPQPCRKPGGGGGVGWFLEVVWEHGPSRHPRFIENDAPCSALSTAFRVVGVIWGFKGPAFVPSKTQCSAHATPPQPHLPPLPPASLSAALPRSQEAPGVTANPKPLLNEHPKVIRLSV